MATRASARLEQSTSGGGGGHDDRESLGTGQPGPFMFSPLDPASAAASTSAGFGTSPALPLDMSTIQAGNSNPNFFNLNLQSFQNSTTNGHEGENENGIDTSEIDIESLLSSLANSSGTGPENFNLGNINLDELFANIASGDGEMDGAQNGFDHTAAGAGIDADAAEEMMKFLAGFGNDEGEGVSGGGEEV